MNQLRYSFASAINIRSIFTVLSFRYWYKSSDFNAELFANELNSTLFAMPAAVSGKSENPFKLSTDSFMAHSRSSIKIQDGCNNSCSYCAIHLARGKSVSLGVESVLERVIQLEKVGQKEVVFTTVNIGHYRGEYNGKYLKFAELLELWMIIFVR